MPSCDDTGKPLSGAQKRRRRAEREGGAPLPVPDELDAARRRRAERETLALGSGPSHTGPPAPLSVPPLPGTVEQAVVWAAGVQARIARMAAQGLDPERVRACSSVVGAMGKLRSYAQDSEDAVITLRTYLREDVEVHGEDPPEDPAGLCAWAFWRLADLLAETATAPMVDESLCSHRARALAQMNHVRPQARLDEIAELTRKQQEE